MEQTMGAEIGDEKITHHGTRTDSLSGMPSKFGLHHAIQISVSFGGAWRGVGRGSAR
jgi:hypothetical protein